MNSSEHLQDFSLRATNSGQTGRMRPGNGGQAGSLSQQSACTPIKRIVMQDNYERLGIPPSATADLIKAAYRKQAAQYHPDKNQSADAPARFRAAQEAYEVLSDPARRKAYDEYRQRNLIEDPLPVAWDMSGKYIQDALK